MYTFRHIAPEQFYAYLAKAPAQGMDVLCRLCDENAVCCSEMECAEYLGKIWALFGQPDDPEGYEDFYSYAIIAENGEETHYLQLAQYCNLPTIYGAPEALAAAKALTELIRNTAPTDYTWTGAYLDYDVEMTYAVKDGVVSAEDKPLGFWDEQTEILNHIIDRVFEVMPPEEANAWVNQYTTEEAMLEYWDAHPELH